jgi:hypothetical protein
MADHSAATIVIGYDQLPSRSDGRINGFALTRERRLSVLF